jgi:FixJ family two-component response regulator
MEEVQQIRTTSAHILDTHGTFAGQIDLLEKPFTEATLLTRVRRAIDNNTRPATPAPER